ncbi:hypothetical protein DWW23_16365 [Parabacteroides sp. AF14-59]|nr:hypothetical protein DWW23_16365 [Parabacteroides sp. AF14-59]
MHMKHILFLFLLSSLLSCMQEREIDPVTKIVNEWKGKVIKFPQHLVYTIQGMDTIPFDTSQAQYKILIYTDSIGCTSCKLKINQWKEFIAHLDSTMSEDVCFLFFFHSQSVKTIRAELYTSNFKYPVCIDINDSINKLNNFPNKFDYQTFLLNNQNKILAIGNPINNSAIKELYLNILHKKISIQKYQRQL